MKVTKSELNFGTHVSGLDLNITQIEIDSEKAGPTVYIQGGIHGGEVTYWITKELFDLVQNQEDILTGKIILIPFANPVSWMQRVYFTTAGKFDMYMGVDWNRHYPGNTEGILGERIANKLFEVAQTADYVIDLHTSRASFPFGIVKSESELELAKMFGLEYNYLLGASEKNIQKYMKTLSGQTSDKGIPSITLECGSHDDDNPKDNKEVFESVVRFLSKIGSLNHKVSEPVSKSKYYTKLLTYVAPDGGLVRFHKNIGDKYSEGDLLFELHNPKSIEEVTKVFAKENGIVQKHSPTHIYWPGDHVLQSLYLEDIKEID